MDAPNTDPDNLTAKQRGWVEEYLKTRNGTEAAMRVYNVGKRIRAKEQSYLNLHNPKIQAVLKKAQLTRERLAMKLASHVDNKDPKVSLEAVKFGFKLHGDTEPQQKVSEKRTQYSKLSNGEIEKRERTIELAIRQLDEQE